MSEKDRSFTVEDSSFGFNGGRYVSPIPSTAGKHAGHVLFRRSKSRAGGSVFLQLREITREAGAKEKVFFYKVTKTKKPANQIKVKTFKRPDGTSVDITPQFEYAVLSVDEVEFRKAKK